MQATLNTSFDLLDSEGFVEWAGGGAIIGIFTLTYTVSGSALNWYLSFDGSITYRKGKPTDPSKFWIEAGNDFTIVNLGRDNIDNGDWSGTLYPNKGSGKLEVGFQPGYPCVIGTGGPAKNLISMNYSGVTTGGGSSSSNLSAEVTIPPLIAAGSQITVTCEMHGPTSQSALAGSGGLAGANSDSVTGILYELLSSDGSTFRRVKTITSNLKGSGTHRQIVDIPLDYGDKRIKYELVVSYGADSITDYSDAVVVKGNNPPSTPEHLYVPSNIAAGERIDISWTPSTDPDNNLYGYFLEYSINGGASWEEVYRGTALETTHYISENTKTIRYRVRAYDDYNTMSSPPRFAPSSGDIYVNNNHAPTTPATITVSPLNPVIGQAIIINWSASSDPDGDDFNYVLERAVDSTTNYTVVYTGKNLNWTDTCGSWETVTYRVKAVDIYGAPSNYAKLTEPRTVISNAAPTITCVHSDGADLGIKTGVFSITYSVDDENPSDVLTVKESIKLSTDSEFTVKRTIYNAERGQEYTFNFRTGSSPATAYWNKLPNNAQNEEYNIKISVSDGTTEVSRTFRFTKSTGAFLITLREPIVSVGDIEKAMVSICGNMPSTALKHVQVTANGGSSWVECILASGAVESGIGNRKKTNSDKMNEELLGGHYLFIAAIPVADMGKSFNFKVQAEKVSNVGGYISSIQGTFIEASAT